MVKEEAESLIHLFDRAVRPDKEIYPRQAVKKGVSFPGPVKDPRFLAPKIESPGDRRRGATDFLKHPVQTVLLPF
jgi:hypothetical protein